ncbi:TraR/DksA family transcriptional regulator [Aeromicrobium sp.]|uniref:TraR/DksA family transcriptional regulator n=1 Tax=Aeromicrobium sp. TaxID=1871063 RepID=UPI003517369C
MDDTTWTPDELDRLRHAMTQERWRLLERVGDHHRSGPVGGDSADRAELGVEAELDVLIETQDRDLLRQVDILLERLESGLYPVCVTCGGPVGRARQEAFPRATTCLDCARRS